jgi:hypothetical protein
MRSTSIALLQGHNVGANHASIMNGGSRGAVAWKDSSNTWVEYGNPHTCMGQARIDATTPDYLIVGKQVLDWMPESSLATVSPFSGSGCSNRCGPWLLQPTDTGSKGGGFLGVQITTSASHALHLVGPTFSL